MDIGHAKSIRPFYQILWPVLSRSICASEDKPKGWVFRFLAPLCNHPRCHYSHLSGCYGTYNTKMNGYWCLLIFKEFEEKSHLIFIEWVSILWMSEQLIEIKNYEVNILIFYSGWYVYMCIYTHTYIEREAKPHIFYGERGSFFRSR